MMVGYETALESIKRIQREQAVAAANELYELARSGAPSRDPRVLAIRLDLLARGVHIPAPMPDSRNPAVLRAWLDKEYGFPRAERRAWAGALEVRTDKGGPPVVTGYAAVFGVPSEVLYEAEHGRFREQIAPGAFAQSLRSENVVLLLEHRDLPLAATRSGTLQLSEDGHGLKFRSELEPTDPDVQRLVPKMRRGDLARCSFGFVPVRDRWDYTSKPPTRTLLQVKLTDVSIVTKPAYPQTEAMVRQEAGR